MRAAHIAEWREAGRWLGWQVVDVDGLVVWAKTARVEKDYRVFLDAKAYCDALNAGGPRAERARREGVS